MSVDKLFSKDANAMGQMLLVAVPESEMTGICTVKLAKCLNL
jgi:hypothetical protein